MHVQRWDQGSNPGSVVLGAEEESLRHLLPNDVKEIPIYQQMIGKQFQQSLFRMTQTAFYLKRPSMPSKV